MQCIWCCSLSAERVLRLQVKRQAIPERLETFAASPRVLTLNVCLVSCQLLLLILQLCTARSQLYVVLDAPLHRP
jgi:hypothetical protein